MIVFPTIYGVEIFQNEGGDYVLRQNQENEVQCIIIPEDFWDKLIEAMQNYPPDED